MTDEKFVDIKGYEGLYQVSNFGRVRNISYFKRGDGLLKPNKKTTGYYRVVLYLDEFKASDNSSKSNSKRIGKAFDVHRLVAIHFIENKSGKPQVNHIDGDKSNNKVDNLEWCTSLENIYHSFSTGLTDKSIAVFEKTKDGKVIKTYTGYRELKEDGFPSCSMIQKSIDKGVPYKGFIFKQRTKD